MGSISLIKSCLAMDDYTPPSVTEYGDVEDLTRGNWQNWEYDGTWFVFGVEDEHPQDPS
jgi:hypothetical protein